MSGSISAHGLGGAKDLPIPSELAIDQALVLTIEADEAGEIHVHSTPEQEISYEAGTSEHEIVVDRPGVVEVESHDPDVILLQLEVR